MTVALHYTSQSLPHYCSTAVVSKWFCRHTLTYGDLESCQHQSFVVPCIASCVEKGNRVIADWEGGHVTESAGKTCCSVVISVFAQKVDVCTEMTVTTDCGTLSTSQCPLIPGAHLDHSSYSSVAVLSNSGHAFSRATVQLGYSLNCLRCSDSWITDFLRCMYWNWIQ